MPAALDLWVPLETRELYRRMMKDVFASSIVQLERNLHRHREVICAEALEHLDKIPFHLRGGLRRYLLDGILPGRFLRACLENDLFEAIGRCNDGTVDPWEGLRSVMGYLYNYTPSGCYGSPEKVRAWLENHPARLLSKSQTSAVADAERALAELEQVVSR